MNLYPLDLYREICLHNLNRHLTDTRTSLYRKPCRDATRLRTYNRRATSNGQIRVGDFRRSIWEELLCFRDGGWCHAPIAIAVKWLRRHRLTKVAITLMRKGRRWANNSTLIESPA
ncbi:hypothetical protein ACFE04_028272 [Oxalis oulophora]